MNPPVQLTLEQQLRLRTFADEVAAMNLEQRRERLVEIHREILMMHNRCHALLRDRWGVRNPSE